MKKKVISLLLLFIASASLFGQGYNHNFLIGYDFAYPPWGVNSDKGIIKIDTLNFNVIGLSRKMKFQGAQANIANANGDILFYTNGCWIANAMEDTMPNGARIATDVIDSIWCSTAGIQWVQSSLILPMPDDSNKYVLFHHGSSYVNPPNDLPLISYYSVIDMSLDNGLGDVIPGQKKITLIQDTLLPGFAACRHANGKDWWVYILKGNSSMIYKVLLTNQGITNISTQNIGVLHITNEAQKCFSPNGKKFAYRYHAGVMGNVVNEVRVFDFDRCTGNFSNPRVVSWPSLYGGLGLAFSSNSKYLYTVSDFDTILQINTDTSNMQASMTVVAINDGYYSPPGQTLFQTGFWTMYLAANGKILISSGSGVVDLHYINYPDSGGLACDVHLHDLHMPCFTFRSNVNHPNYYLGCDTTQTNCPCLITGVNNLSPPDFKFRVYPNPVTNGVLNIGYLLPQSASGGKSGLFEMVDVTGKVVFKYTLPPWSNEQAFKLPDLANGVYNCVIWSDGKRVSRKVAVIRE